MTLYSVITAFHFSFINLRKLCPVCLDNIMVAPWVARKMKNSCHAKSHRPLPVSSRFLQTWLSVICKDNKIYSLLTTLRLPVCQCQNDVPTQRLDIISLIGGLVSTLALRQNIFISIQENEIFLYVCVYSWNIFLCVEYFLCSSITVTTCVSWAALYNSFVLPKQHKIKSNTRLAINATFRLFQQVDTIV